MLKRYEKFLEELDRELQGYFLKEKEFIKCKKGCTDCCSVGEYPLSRLEAEYLMHGFVTLPREKKDIIRKNISELKIKKRNFNQVPPSPPRHHEPCEAHLNKGERFLYKCPFLVDNACAVYERRGIVCRTFGLAYLRSDNTIKLPNCAAMGLNYAENFNKETGEIFLNDPIKKELTIDGFLRSPLAERFELECGEIRPLIDWF